MTSLKIHRRLLALYFTAFCIIGLFLAKMIANFVAIHTTQISPNYNIDRLIGSYAENDSNHRPMQNASKIDFRSLPTQEEMSNLVLFTYIPGDNTDTTSIVFENLTINNFFTPEKDKNNGFDGVLRPLKYMSNANLDNLVELRSQINAGSEFPEGCLFKAFNDSFGLSYGIGWEATKSCQRPSAPIKLSGFFRRGGIALRSDMMVKLGESDIKINHKKRNAYFRKIN